MARAKAKTRVFFPAPSDTVSMPATGLPATQLLKRPAQLRAWALLGLLLLALLILVGMIWRNLERVDSLGSYVSYWHRIQIVNQGMKKALMDHLSHTDVIDRSELIALSDQVQTLVTLEGHLDPDTPAKLLAVEHALAAAGSDKETPEALQGRLLAAMANMNAVLDGEVGLREKTLSDINRSTHYEVAWASATLTAILLFSWFFLRLRILAPLQALRELLLRLAQEDFRPIETERLDPLLLPVFNSYNDMVHRLAELEEVKRLHAESLEAEVRAATRALLEQQRSLAEAEKLAAVGELAAGIAHELRNPLAGIQMSCANLRREVEDPDQAQRLDLIGAELKRMSRLLTDLIEKGKQTPAPARECRIEQLVRELVALTRYQIPSQVRLRYDVHSDLVCRLPDSNVRQALLNLVLNAAQALDGNKGEIMIRAWRDGDWLHLSVSDDGPGFSAELLQRGVRPFVSGSPQGTGLGLAIVQRVVRDIGGHLQLTNQLPKGARVVLTLPFQPA